MRGKVVGSIILSNLADFFTGMSTAWAFAAVDSISRASWWDLLSSLFLATLCFGAAISIKVKLYVKRA